MYLAWFDADRKKPVEQKIAEARDRYLHKFGNEPTICLVNPAEVPAEPLTTSPVELRPLSYISRNCFWIGCDEQVPPVDAPPAAPEAPATAPTRRSRRTRVATSATTPATSPPPATAAATVTATASKTATRASAPASPARKSASVTATPPVAPVVKRPRGTRGSTPTPPVVVAKEITPAPSVAVAEAVTSTSAPASRRSRRERKAA